MDLFKEYGITLDELYDTVANAYDLVMSEELTKERLFELAETIEAICYKAGYTK